jgi:hypothetical protein
LHVVAGAERQGDQGNNDEEDQADHTVTTGR